jgi:CheY-like chemotaxis protein
MAHELRNPLAPVRTAARVLKDRSPPDPELTWARDVIDRQVGHMARLLDDLLDVSRITRDKLELRRQPVELASAVAAAVEASRPLIEAGGHTLTVELPSEGVWLDADPVRLAQVFSNLLNNAAKYTERGGSIRLRGGREAGEVVVAVSDTGIGIEAEMLPRVFEMFAQATPALERSQGGLGIGLSLVKGIVELHGGTVEARSDGPGLGSTFLVRLPSVPAPACAEPPPVAAEAAAPAGRRLRVLVADDNADAAESLAVLLRMLGNEVRTAGDGQEAVERIEEFRPDVAVLDIGMPRMNGYEAARHIRSLPHGANVFLVALTGWGQEEDRRRSREAGFDAHLVKPVDPGELATVLASVTGPTA